VGSRLSRGRECDRRRGQRWEDPAPAACLAETPRPERRATPPWCPTWCAQPSTAPVTMAAPFPPPPWDALQRGDPAALPTVHDLPLAQVRFPAHPPAATSCAAVRRVARPPARYLPSSSPAIANLSALVTTALPPLSSASLSLVPARPFVATPSVLALCLRLRALAASPPACRTSALFPRPMRGCFSSSARDVALGFLLFDPSNVSRLPRLLRLSLSLLKHAPLRA
jgi:hypothetical protein